MSDEQKEIENHNNVGVVNDPVPNRTDNEETETDEKRLKRNKYMKEYMRRQREIKEKLKKTDEPENEEPKKKETKMQVNVVNIEEPKKNKEPEKTDEPKKNDNTKLLIGLVSIGLVVILIYMFVKGGNDEETKIEYN